MTVKELIEKLQALPPDAVVMKERPFHSHTLMPVIYIEYTKAIPNDHNRPEMDIWWPDAGSTDKSAIDVVEIS
jgi:hypothetical protein